MIEVSIQGVVSDSESDSYVMLLKEKQGEKILPIFIGANEAAAIIVALEGVPFPRPLTHDLLKLVIDALNGKVIRVVVTDLNKDTFYAKIYIETNGNLIGIDARPSDSVALAVRAKSPVYVADSIMESNGLILKNLDELKTRLRNLNPEDFGNYQL
ncbi:MAG: bifunctional nuclease family protein [candidate division WOR-3 bacterium]